jgi:Uma2 family endonuclease
MLVIEKVQAEMSTILIVPHEVREQRVLMNHVSWETYEGLLEAHADSSSPRMTYDHGMLEVMSPSTKHEDLKVVAASIVELVAEERDLEFKGLGLTTFRRREFEQGLEPDSCFYLQSVELIRAKEEIDPSVDPPPDLVIEIEITRPAVSKLPIYARLGVPEVWVVDGQRGHILCLSGDSYQPSEESQVLAPLTATVLSGFLERSRTLKTLAWRRTVREWARQQRS